MRADLVRDDGHGVVVIGIFQRAADRFKDLVRRDPAAAVVIVAPKAVVLIGGGRIEGALADGGPGWA
jgi:hypothetical protein